MAENTIDCFCMDAEQKYIYAGDKSGRVLVLSAENLELLTTVQVHYGSITTITRHPRFNYLATLGNDGHIGLLKVDGQSVEFLQLIESRNVKPNDDPYLRNHTTTQALAFHESKKRLVGHGGSSALFEVEFSDTTYELIHCTRVHANDDFLTARYVPNTDKVLSGSVRGSVVLSEGGVIERQWDFHSSESMPSIHWFELLKGSEYAVACDGMRVIRLDISNDENTLDGPVIAKDHLEHTTYCHSSGKLYCASFDRSVMEVDPVTCEKVKTVWHAPFKLRWIKVFESAPNLMIVQCRNGGLYKVCIEEGKVLAQYKTTPDALWSIVALNDRLIAGGEGNEKLELTLNGELQANRLKTFHKQQTLLDLDDYYYTKRLASCSANNLIAHGRTNGQLLIESKDGETLRAQTLSSAIRDCAFNAEGSQLFVATESGGLYRISTLTDEDPVLINQADLPCWCLAYNATRNLLAYADRHKRAYVIDLETMQKQCIAEHFGFIKRMKWQDDSHLLIGSAGSLFRHDIDSNETKPLFALENTVEDFDWDEQQRYLIIVDYTRFLYLCDFTTGEVLFEQGDMADYSKGVVFLDKLSNFDGYPGDFVVVGRSGGVSYHRVHDDRILSYGFV